MYQMIVGLTLRFIFRMDLNLTHISTLGFLCIQSDTLFIGALSYQKRINNLQRYNDNQPLGLIILEAFIDAILWEAQ